MTVAGTSSPELTARVDQAVFALEAAGVENARHDAEVLLAPSIERLAKNFLTLLRDIVADPGRRVSRLDVLHPDRLGGPAISEWLAGSGPRPRTPGDPRIGRGGVARLPSLLEDAMSPECEEVPRAAG